MRKFFAALPAFALALILVPQAVAEDKEPSQNGDKSPDSQIKLPSQNSKLFPDPDSLDAPIVGQPSSGSLEKGQPDKGPSGSAATGGANTSATNASAGEANKTGQANGDSAKKEKKPPKPEIVRVNEKRTNLLLFPLGSEVFFGNIGGCADVVLIAAHGTTFSSDNSRLVMHTGRALIDTGKEPLVIGTRLGVLRLAPESTIDLQMHPRQPMRVIAVGNTRGAVKPASGAEGYAVTIITKGRRGQAVSLKPGEELVLHDSVLSPDVLETSDKFERRPQNLVAEVRGLDLKKFTVPLDQYFALRTADVETTHKLLGNKQAAYNRMVAHMAGATKDTALAGKDVQYNPHEPGKNALESSEPLHIMAAGGTEFSQTGDGNLALRTGTLFCHVPMRVKVDTPVGSVIADKDALLSVDADGGMLRARAVTGPADVWVQIGGQKIAINAGTELLITDHPPKKEEISPADDIGRRDPKTKTIGNGLYATSSDFSLVSLVTGSEFLYPLRKPLNIEDRKIVDRIERTAAALETVTRARGPFKANTKVRSSTQSQSSSGAF